MFQLFISPHPHILISLGSCALAGILTSSHFYILLFVRTCLYSRIIASSYPQVHKPSHAPLQFHILRFALACLQPHIPKLWQLNVVYKMYTKICRNVGYLHFVYKHFVYILYTSVLTYKSVHHKNYVDNLYTKLIQNVYTKWIPHFNIF